LVQTIETFMPDLPPSMPADGKQTSPNGHGGQLDRAALLAIVEGDWEILGELIKIFLADTPGLLADLRNAVTQRDTRGIAFLAHRLRGSVANFHAQTAVATAQRLEETAGRGDLLEVETMLGDFERATGELIEGLKSFTT
jgi:HPt (histidine-containing phosphotransfer) domain-containing protein